MAAIPTVRISDPSAAAPAAGAVVGAPAAPRDLPAREARKPARPAPGTVPPIPGGAQAVPAPLGSRKGALPPKEESLLRETTGELNNVLKNFNRKIRFDIREGAPHVVAQIVDRDTNEVIKTVPPESMIRLLERIDEAIGLLVDEAR